MRKIFVFSVCVLCMLSIAAQDTTMTKDTVIKQKVGPASPNSAQYCAAFRDGKMTIMIDDKTINKDIELQNGNKITVNGKVVRKNGSVMILKNGECVDKEGNITDKASLK